MLIRLGATPISSSAHILEALGFKTEKDKTTKNLELKNLSDDERKVLSIIENPIGRDELIRELTKLGISVGNGSALLSIMEIKGLIEEKLGEIRAIC